jgi:hypothetical protein
MQRLRLKVYFLIKLELLNNTLSGINIKVRDYNEAVKVKGQI